ncbi:MAG: carboxypeptidase-like regulatory domain-containing protein [Bacteroidales bacterium]|nr:carboxypeptidase-like regulatory domain-containing protein [Candidatus Colicola coprequi]
MRHYLSLTIALFAVLNTALAGIKVTGTILDQQTDESLIGASVMEQGTSNGTITDIDGNFTITVEENATLEISYIGYANHTIKVRKAGSLGIIKLESEVVTLSDVTITGQMAVQRKTPVAVSQVTALEIEERLMGNTEFVEVLKNTPGVHYNREGGGWGDSEIYMRGFDNTNVAVLVNGVPMNGMEDSKVYWSNWQGLGDVTSVMQTQRGLGAAKMSAPSVGGTINIITKGIDAKKGGHISYALGNDGFNKVMFTVSTGLMKNGWAVTVLGSKTWGNGYIMGTDFSGYSYFANISKRINERHQLSLTGFGAPQWHNQRAYQNGLTMSEWNSIKRYMKDGMHWTRYNPMVGHLNGEKFNANHNVYHKPQISLNHVWQIDHQSSLSSSAYVSIGRGYGLTAENGLNSTLTYSDLTSAATYGKLKKKFWVDATGEFDYDAVVAANQASEYGSEIVLCENRNYHNWYGVTSTYSNRLKDMIDLTAGIDVRYYEGIHNAVICDMLGGAYYIDATRSGSAIKAEYNSRKNDPAWVNEKLGIGDVCYRDYTGYVVQEGAFLQAEYSKDAWSAFVNGAVNLNHYWKYDRYYYDAAHARSNTLTFVGGTIKAGANYNINNHNNIYLNVGYISRAPKFDKGAFMNASTSNVENREARNEQVASAEIGYGFHNEFVNIAVNGYFTEWMDKTMTAYTTLDNQSTGYLNMTGVNARHMGLEFELKSCPTRWLEINAMLSIGDWQWDKDGVKGYYYDEQGTPVSKTGTFTTAGAEDHAWAMINMKGIKVGGSAQTTANLGVTFKPFKGFRIGAEYTLYDRNYSYYSFSGSNLSINKSVDVMAPMKLPTGGQMDMRASYSFPLGKCNATISGNINNVLDQIYIEKAWNPSTVTSASVTEANMDNIYMFFSYGRTWNIRLKVAF